MRARAALTASLRGLIPATLVAATVAHAQPMLVRDIETATDGSSPRQLTVAGDRVFFTAYQPSTGLELWSSDGSAAGTALVSDLTPGATSSIPQEPLAIGTAVFFSAFAPETGQELWRADGPHTVSVVKDIVAGSGSSMPRGLTEVAGTLFFVASEPGTGWAVWRSDGTDAGTVRVKVLGPAADPRNLTAAGGALYFTAVDAGSGRELWTSDGTEAGTVLIADLVAGPGSSSPSQLTAAGTLLFFTADLVVPGFTIPSVLHRSDGTPAGTVAIGPPAFGLGAVGGTLFFGGFASATCVELWKSDGTMAGTVLVKDIFPGCAFPCAEEFCAGHSSPAALTDVGGTLYFTAEDGAHGRELWKSDGTAAGTVLVKDVDPASSPASFYQSGPTAIAAVAGTVFFSADDGTSGRELWRSDGTAAGTIRVADLRPGAEASGPDEFVALGGTLFFSADDGQSGPELWRSDGTTAGTALVADIGTVTGSSTPNGLTDVDGTLFFFASTRATGDELWKSDGTADGTTMAREIVAGPTGSFPRHLTPFGGRLILQASTPESGTELWQSDGTAAGTELLKDINPGPGGSVPGSFTPSGGRLFFVASDPAGGGELWATDGTTAGTARVADLRPGPESAGVHELADAGGTLMFAAYDFDAFFGSTDLWKSDGTAAGTVRVKDMDPTGLGAVHSLRYAGGTLFFQGFDQANGFELWKSDGTDAGTVLVKDITPFGSSSPRALTNVAGRLFFVASDNVTGYELWTSDGTEAGTVLVRDVRPGIQSSDPTDLTEVDGNLFFTADDGQSGRELWRSDGTAAGTIRVKDIRPGSGSAIGDLFSTALLTAAGNLLFFEASDGLSGVELWRSDGTAEGTVLVADLNPGSADSVPAPIAVANGKLFFGADAPVAGRELWALQLEIPAPACATILGERFRMRSNGTDPAKRRIVVQARESASPDALVGDPLAQGATIEIVANGTTPGTFVLPAGQWTRGGAGWLRRDSGAYGYRDRRGLNGPVAHALLKRSRRGTFVVRVQVLGRNGPVPAVPATGSEASLRATIGGGGCYCARFGGPAGGQMTTTTGMLRIDGPTAEAGCL